MIEATRGLRKFLVGLLMLGLLGCAPARSNELTFSTWGSLDEMEILKPILAEFQRENPDIPVKLIHIPDEYPHKIRLMAASHTMPDVLFMENQTLTGFANRGVLRDLGPFLAKDSKIKASDFYSPVLKALSWKGKLYAIPRDLSNLVIYYNKTMFDQAGVSYPKANWTYEDMVKKALRLTKGENQFGIGFSPYPIYWLPYLWSDGGDVMDPTMTRCTLMDPVSLAALQRYLDLRSKYHVAPTESDVGNARMSQLFAEGKLAMMVGGRWDVPGFRKRITFSWDVAPFPRGKVGSIVDADASGWAMSTQCQHPNKAWRLIRFLASKKSISAFTKSGLIVPSRPDVANSPVFKGSGPPEHSQVFLDAIKTARPTLAPPSYDEIEYELIDSLPLAWDGEQTLEQTLKPISKRIDLLLKEDQQ